MPDAEGSHAIGDRLGRDAGCGIRQRIRRVVRLPVRPPLAVADRRPCDPAHDQEHDGGRDDRRDDADPARMPSVPLDIGAWAVVGRNTVHHDSFVGCARARPHASIIP